MNRTLTDTHRIRLASRLIERILSLPDFDSQIYSARNAMKFDTPSVCGILAISRHFIPTLREGRSDSQARVPA